MLDRYNARPWHLLLSVALLALGSVTMSFKSWGWFSLLTILLGFGSGIWIIMSGYFEAYGAQWDRWTRFADTMKNNHNPVLWHAMGFELPEENFRAEIDVPTQELSNPYPATERYDIPCPLVQFTTMCDGVLMGQPLSEGYWVGTTKVFSSPTFRKVKKKLEDKKAIRLKIAGSTTQGFVLTAIGRKLFLKYCSAGIRKMVGDQQFLVDPRPPSGKELPA
jgi:hypothetical protein